MEPKRQKLKDKMSNKEVIKRLAPTTYEGIVKLTDIELQEMAQEELNKIIPRLFEILEDLELNNEGGRAQTLRSKIELFCKYSQPVGGPKDLRRQDWERNHVSILRVIHNHVNQYYSFPAINLIAKEAQLSRQTVYEHLNEGIASEFYQEHLKTWQYLSVKIFTYLYKETINGNVAASKVLLDNIYRMNQPAPTNIKQQNNYVQINNTRIDEVTINELPNEARLQIENILNQYKKQTA